MVRTFRTPHVLFLLATQDAHDATIEESIGRGLTVWEGQIEAGIAVLNMTCRPDSGHQPEGQARICNAERHATDVGVGSF